MIFLDYTTATSSVSDGTLYTAGFKCMVVVRVESATVSGTRSFVRNSTTGENIFTYVSEAGGPTSSQSTTILNSGEVLSSVNFSALSVTLHIFRLPEAP